MITNNPLSTINLTKPTRPTIYLAIFLFLGLVLVFFLIFRPFSAQTSNPKPEGETQITIKQGDNTFYIQPSGFTNFSSPTQNLSQIWDKNRTAKFFNQIFQLLKSPSSSASGNLLYITYTDSNGSTTIALSDDHPAIKDLFDPVTPTPSVSISDLFSSPTPPFTFITPTPRPGNPTNPTPTTDPRSDCPYWLLSYCVYPHPPTPSASSTTPTVFIPTSIPDCNTWNQFGPKRTTISNEVCIKTPSPTP